MGNLKSRTVSIGGACWSYYTFYYRSMRLAAPMKFRDDDEAEAYAEKKWPDKFVTGMEMVVSANT